MSQRTALRALTVWQPWCWALTVGIKPVENRTWAPPASAIGKDLALHASKRSMLEDDAEEVHAFRDIVRRPDLAGRWNTIAWPTLADLPLGAVTAVVRLVGAVHEGGRCLGDVSAERAKEILADPFWVGPWGWVVDEVRALAAPAPCRGAQGLWSLPLDVEARVWGEVQRGV